MTSIEPSSAALTQESDAVAAANGTATTGAPPPAERDTVAPAAPATASLQQPEAPSSQSLPLPPLTSSAPAPPAVNGSPQHPQTQQGGDPAAASTNRAASFVAKRRFGAGVSTVSTAYGGLSSAPTSAITTSSPLAAHHMHQVQVPTASPLGNGGGVNGIVSQPNGTGATAVPPTTGSSFPALHLHPLNDTFVPKQIWLSPAGTRVKIGRQTSLKTVPNATNGYFDSKVLSRMHAEIWTEDGRIWIKDVKSSNGTFINGERLSPEGVESEAFELHTEDIVEFGIDIVSDDNKTIVHHKVAAKVFLVLSAEDAAASSREFATYYRESPMHRRPSRAGPFASGGFDLVLSRLQSELEKSRATGSELGHLNTAMSDIQDTLSGGAGPPPPLPPPFQPGGRAGPAGPGPGVNAQTLAVVQSQLAETQAALGAHMDKIRALEGLLAEHEGIKHELGSLRSQMEESKREVEVLVKGGGNNNVKRRGLPASGEGGRVSPVAAMLEADEDDATDDDDSRSVSSIDTVTLDSDLRASSSSSSPKKTLPNGVAHHHDTSTSPPPDSPISSAATTAADARRLAEQNRVLTDRLEDLSAELDEATTLGNALRSQHADAAATVRALEQRVEVLEADAEGRVAKSYELAQGRFAEWKKEIEAGWHQQRQGWEAEREKLIAVIRDWEERSSGSEDGGGGISAPAVVAGAVGATAVVAAAKAKGKKKGRRKRRTNDSANTTAAASAPGGLLGKLGGAGRGGATSGPLGPARLAELPMDEFGTDSDSTAIVGPGDTPPKGLRDGPGGQGRSGPAWSPMLGHNAIPILSAAAGAFVLGVAWTVAAGGKIVPVVKE